MPKRPRRFTVHSAAVLSVLSRHGNESWTIGEVADECGLAYASVYTILNRLFDDGLVARVELDGVPVGHPRLHFELSKLGKRNVQRIHKFMPDPVAALHGGWKVQAKTA
jgi:DNA-binding IclR family transcriptional regulator